MLFFIEILDLTPDSWEKSKKDISEIKFVTIVVQANQSNMAFSLNTSIFSLWTCNLIFYRSIDR